MNNPRKSRAILATLTFAFAPILLHAQDAPPPPDGAYAPPPPQDNSGAPPPPDGSAPPPDAGGDSGASFQQFYDQLGSQGQWVQTDQYGYAFQPNVSDPNWAPYTDGHWVYTDVGWTWASDEPWGWATYHYGRWANIDGTGWVWIPGYQWAPAWVSWRYGGGYAGWAPLPPASFIGVDFAEPGIDIGIGFHFGSDCDVNYGIGAGCYNFISVDYIGDPYYRGRYFDRRRNFELINHTRNITNINYNRGERGAFRGVNVGGPSLDEVNAHAHTRMEKMNLAESGRAGRSTLSGNTLNVYAPHFNPATAHSARPARVAETLSNVRLNRGTSISEPLAVNAHLRPAAASEEQIEAARRAEASAPAGSRIATSQTQPRVTLNRPLTTLETPAAARQARAADNRDLNQEHAQTEKDDRVQKAEADKTANQERAQTEKDDRVQKAEADKTANQERAQTEKDDRVQKAEADKTANQERAQTEKDDRVQKAEADKTANQEHAQTEKQDRDAAGAERAARLQQEEAAHQQALKNAAQARQERAAAVPQQHGPVPQERAPATRAAPAQGGAAKDKDKNN